MNKRKGIHEAPREILRAIPGLTFRDVDHVTQWSYCSGGGAGLPIERPDLTAEISRRRLEKAAELEVDTLVSACVWSERPLAAAGEAKEIDVVDLMELVAARGGPGGLRWPRLQGSTPRSSTSWSRSAARTTSSPIGPPG